MLRVSPGDTVNASVWGKYADKTYNSEHLVDNIFTLLATAFGLNAATSEAGLAANGMENALAGQAAITPDGNAPKAYLNIYSWIKISTRTVIMIWASSVYHQEP